MQVRQAHSIEGQKVTQKESHKKSHKKTLDP